MRRRWTLTEDRSGEARYLSDQLKLHPLVARVLANRGVTELAAVKKFLNRFLDGMHDPSLMPGLPEAATRIHDAITAGRKICIYGDYDVDGMCGSSILLEVLRIAGATPRYYVPDRLEEGYGLNSKALHRLKDEGVELVVTVDCGIASVKEAIVARELGLELIITDHHEQLPETPAADVVVHPRLDGSTYPFGFPCGAGVAYKLAWEIARRVSNANSVRPEFRQFLLNATSLAAIGTVCDIVPLLDENRILVHHGLRAIKSSTNVGLRELIACANLSEKEEIEVGDVGFKLGPRLNACGRLGHARLGIELLTTKDARRARELAHYLDEENTRRQTFERKAFTRAKELASQIYNLDDPNDHRPIVLFDDQLHGGIIGIVASRMVERFHRPCIIMTKKGELAVGSGRSVPGFHLQQLLHECRDVLITSGGHAMAAGMRVSLDRIEEFRERFHEFEAIAETGKALAKEVKIDAELPLSAINFQTLRELARLEPFGAANPAPVFLASGVDLVEDPKTVGGGDRHLSFRVSQADGRPYRAISWNQGERLPELQSNKRCSIVFKPSINYFNGFSRIDLEVVDFHAGDDWTSADPDAPNEFAIPITPTTSPAVADS